MHLHGCGQAAKKILGIDPGKMGGWATWDGEVLNLYAIPLSTKSKQTILTYELAVAIQPTLDSHVAYVEFAASRPRQSSTATFSFGFNTGLIHGILSQAAVPMVTVAPSKWKKYYDIGPDKVESTALAADLFPRWANQFYGPRGGLKDGLAEAALIARYGWEMEHDDGT